MSNRGKNVNSLAKILNSLRDRNSTINLKNNVSENHFKITNIEKNTSTSNDFLSSKNDNNFSLKLKKYFFIWLFLGI